MRRFAERPVPLNFIPFNHLLRRCERHILWDVHNSVDRRTDLDRQLWVRTGIKLRREAHAAVDLSEKSQDELQAYYMNAVASAGFRLDRDALMKRFNESAHTD